MTGACGEISITVVARRDEKSEMHLLAELTVSNNLFYPRRFGSKLHPKSRTTGATWEM